MEDNGNMQTFKQLYSDIGRYNDRERGRYYIFTYVYIYIHIMDRIGF